MRRQVDWLHSDGWQVDTLGLGAHPSADVRDHFELHPPKKWTLTKWGTALTRLLIPHRQTFRLITLHRIPESLRSRIRRGRYDLVLFNETEFNPWLAVPKDFTRQALQAHIHLDLHEYHNPTHRRKTLGGKIESRYYRWIRAFIGSKSFDSRTVVNDPIGQLYSHEFGFEPPTQIRNIPPFAGLTPSDVNPNEIRLIFHGLASFRRGFPEILEAMHTLPKHFSMTFMLMPNEKVHRWLREQIEMHPAGSRIHIVPPAPMREIPSHINEYDLEIIFYRPTSKNLEFAQPNKFFESIQAGLGVVVAESKTMAPIVRKWGNGVVVAGFEGSDLHDALVQLSAQDIAKMKAQSELAAHELNAEQEGTRFLEMFTRQK